MITPEVIVAIITVFGGALVKIIYDMAQARKDNSELRKMLDAQALRAKKRDHITYRLNTARDERAEAFDEYNQAVMHLEIDHARSYISGNDKAKLRTQLDKAEKARCAYKDANSKYYETLQEVNKELLKLDEDE